MFPLLNVLWAENNVSLSLSLSLALYRLCQGFLYLIMYHSYLDGSVVAADVVDAEEDALAVLLLVSGSEIALQKK